MDLPSSVKVKLTVGSASLSHSRTLPEKPQASAHVLRVFPSVSGYGEEQVTSKEIKEHRLAGRRPQTWNSGLSNILLRYAIG